PGATNRAPTPRANGSPNIPGPPPPPRPWSERATLDRQMVRARFAFRDRPVITYALVGINVAVYLICAIVSHNFIQPSPSGLPGAGDTAAMLNNPIYIHGDLAGIYIQQNPVQAYRILTSMFLHENWLHIGLNMWSLYILGAITERVFGAWRYTALYFISGILAGVVQAIVQPHVASLGASGAIFGVFGAFGAFIWLRRRQLGRAGSALISQWVILIVINLVIDVSNTSSIAIWDHVGGIATGLILGAIFVMTSNRKKAPESRL
ncbi:MAG: rhomboid family intramembrane serine protease, partial [Ktedonobacterales bacterium]